MQSMIEQISMTAVAAASSALTGDEGVRTARSTQAAIRSELRAVADDQHAVIDSVTTLEATAGDLTAQVEEHSRSISSLEDGAQALWSVKTQVGDIKAGIGLLVDSYGQSQVMISASQMFVFDPNSNAPTQALFAVSNGAVAIRKAIIEQATIETVTAMSITADYVKAGVALNAPVINGGSLLIGSGDNSLQAEGGSLAVGKGGGYSQFGANWHTVIYADGSIYTDRLNAANGTFTGTVNANAGTFNNVTINENCDVRGTIYANRIVGDVVALRQFARVGTSGDTISNGKILMVQEFWIAAADKPRTMWISGSIVIPRYASANNTGTSVMLLNIDGSNVVDVRISASGSVDGFYTINPGHNVHVILQLTDDYDNSGFGQVMIAQQSNGTFL